MTVGLDLSALSPQDAVVALRSYPRRYRALLEPITDDDNLERLAARPGPDGISAMDHAAETARRLTVAAAALQQIAVSDDPEVPDAAGNAASPVGVPTGPVSLPWVLDQVQAGALAVADAADRYPADAWGRSGTLEGGGRVTALDVLLEAVRSGAENLRRAEHAIGSARAG